MSDETAAAQSSGAAAQSSGAAAQSSGAAAQSSGTPPPRWLLKAFTRLNVWVYRASGGRLMGTLAGDPICLVEMTGARSGKPRTIPLMYVPHNDDVLLVASQGGAPRHPVWYHNLKAYPEIHITQGGERRAMRAEELPDDERIEAWPTCVAHYAPYDEYQTRTDRLIPVFRCRPR